MADEQAVSDEQLEANKQHKERKRWARLQHIAGRVANTLVESRTLRNPLIPQPEPDADPLVPLRFRPERSRNPENNIEGNPMGESRTGGEDAERTHIPKPGKEAPQVEPQVVDIAAAERDAEADAHAKHVEAGKKAAATRVENEQKAKRSAAAKKAAASRAKGKK
jgi:hypothetical protein